ncbi:MAG: sigma-70 family RNA polymerase sigma factor [Pirellulales bacterium]
MPPHLMTSQAAPDNPSPAQTCSTRTDWSQLLASARDGDSRAMGDVCERLHEYLLLTAERGLASDLRSKMGASDIVQQSLLDAQNDINRFKGASEAEFRAWLVRIIEHNLIDAARRFRHTQRRNLAREVSLDQQINSAEIAGKQKTASSIIRRAEIDDELLAAIARLSTARRRVVELRQRDGLSFVQISSEMGISEAAARKQWARALVDLRIILSRSNVERSKQIE